MKEGWKYVIVEDGDQFVVLDKREPMLYANHWDMMQVIRITVIIPDFIIWYLQPLEVTMPTLNLEMALGHLLTQLVVALDGRKAFLSVRENMVPVLDRKQLE